MVCHYDDQENIILLKKLSFKIGKTYLLKALLNDYAR